MSSNLRLPGPTPLPDAVRSAMARDMIDPRGPEFTALLARCTELLRKFYQTEKDVLIFPGVGTGGLEAAVVNSFSPGDAALAVTTGVYGDRFARIAEAFGVDVRRLSLPRGRAAEPDQLREALDENADVAAVLLTHNETSTGVTNPLPELAPLVKERELLLLVDAIGSMGAVPVRTDELGLDVVVSASQKAWMMPPGLVMLGVSEKAWEAAKRARLPRYYWDLRTARASLEKGLTPYTPAVSLFYALHAGLELMETEGLDAIWRRHTRLGGLTRDGLKALGLRLFADERHASDTVTAFRPPDGMDADELRSRLAAEHGVLIAGGQAEMAGRILRVGHMGMVGGEDVRRTLRALSAALAGEETARPT